MRSYITLALSAFTPIRVAWAAIRSTSGASDRCRACKARWNSARLPSATIRRSCRRAYLEAFLTVACLLSVNLPRIGGPKWAPRRVGTS